MPFINQQVKGMVISMRNDKLTDAISSMTHDERLAFIEDLSDKLMINMDQANELAREHAVTIGDYDYLLGLAVYDVTVTVVGDDVVDIVII